MLQSPSGFNTCDNEGHASTKVQAEVEPYLDCYSIKTSIMEPLWDACIFYIMSVMWSCFIYFSLLTVKGEPGKYINYAMSVV